MEGVQTFETYECAYISGNFLLCLVYSANNPTGPLVLNRNLRVLRPTLIAFFVGVNRVPSCLRKALPRVFDFFGRYLVSDPLWRSSICGYRRILEDNPSIFV